MSSGVKLGLLLTINLLAILGIIHHQMKLGSSYKEAVHFIWDRVVLNRGKMFRRSAGQDWLILLHRLWWVTLWFSLGLWLFAQQVFFTLVLLFLAILHGYWYLYAESGNDGFADRLLSLNANWGIIFQEVQESSVLKNKSLAGLDLRKKNLLVLAIERENKFLTFPKGVETLLVGDKLVLFGDLNYYRGLLDEA